MFNNRSFSAEEVLCKSIQDAKEWQDAQPGKRQVMPISVGPDLASSPSGEVLCRSDAAWRQDLMLAGLGWTFTFNLTGAKSLHSIASEFVSSPFMAECIAARAALTEAFRIGIKDLTMESDCAQLIRALNSGSSPSEVYGVIFDIFIISSTFEKFSCRFIPRAANS